MLGVTSTFGSGSGCLCCRIVSSLTQDPPDTGSTGSTRAASCSVPSPVSLSPFLPRPQSSSTHQHRLAPAQIYTFFPIFVFLLPRFFFLFSLLILPSLHYFSSSRILDNPSLFHPARLAVNPPRPTLYICRVICLFPYFFQFGRSTPSSITYSTTRLSHSLVDRVDFHHLVFGLRGDPRQFYFFPFARQPKCDCPFVLQVWIPVPKSKTLLIHSCCQCYKSVSDTRLHLGIFTLSGKSSSALPSFRLVREWAKRCLTALGSDQQQHHQQQ